MSSKKKLIVSMLVVAFVLLSIIATVAIAFALTQQTIKTSLNIGYTVEDIDGTASATFTIGGVTENLTAMKGENVIGDTLVFKAGDTENVGNLMFPEDALALTAQNDNVVIQYTYSNTGEKHYIASMSFDGNIEADNMKVEYSIDGVTYSEDRYAVVVPANTSNKSYWIKISIEDKAKSASFTGDFNWLLNGCDPQDKEYLSMPDLEFQGSDGSYSASIASNSEYVGNLVFPSEVNGDPVTTIANNSSLTAAQRAQVTSTYIPDSVETIEQAAFGGFTNLETVTFEQNESVSVASASSSTGLITIDDNAFSDCAKLKGIIIPDTVTKIGYYAFFNCNGLKSVTLGKSVTTIRDEAFFGCTSLKSFEILASVTNMDSKVFDNCTNLKNITTHTQNENVLTAIKGIANVNGEMNLTIENVTSFDSIFLRGCTGLKSVILGSGVTSMGGTGLFDGCTGLKSIVIGKDVTNIELPFIGEIQANIIVHEENSKYKVVNNCLIDTSTKTLIHGTNNSIIPSDGSVTKIEMQAFDWCNFVEITIPESITVIGTGAFTNCSSLQRIILENPNGWTAIHGVFLDPESRVTVTEDLSNPEIAADIMSEFEYGTFIYAQFERI